jgi:hypothetical protein
VRTAVDGVSGWRALGGGWCGEWGGRWLAVTMNRSQGGAAPEGGHKRNAGLAWCPSWAYEAQQARASPASACSRVEGQAAPG